MELTKHGHACVVLSEGGQRLVIDPGAFTDPGVLEGASAVLVTHEHFDHFTPDVLRAAMDADPALEVWTNHSVAGQLEGLGSRCTWSVTGTRSRSPVSTSPCTASCTR
jgi:L-ascorbate metabolism protein UlaG (beta-lactamase superfamily)